MQASVSDYRAKLKARSAKCEEGCSSNSCFSIRRLARGLLSVARGDIVQTGEIALCRVARRGGRGHGDHGRRPVM